MTIQVLHRRDDLGCMCQEKKEDDSPPLGIKFIQQQKDSKTTLKRAKKD